MKKPLLLIYQLLTGTSDTATGLLLIFFPSLTFHLMRVHIPAAALPFASYVGAFVLAIGIACLYGFFLVLRGELSAKLEVVWLLTAITRGLVAAFVVGQIVSGSFETRWITVAITDGLFALIQMSGLNKGWLADARNQ